MENVSRRSFVSLAAAAGAAGLTAVGAAAAPTEAQAAYDSAYDTADMYEEWTNAELDAMILNQTMVTEDYVTPSGKVIPAVYINLRNKLNRIGNGLGSDIEGNEGAWDYVMFNFSEQDAAYMLEMPLYKTFSAMDYAAVSGRSIDECKAILEDIGGRGLITTRVRAGVPYYHLITMEPGIWERNIDRWQEDGYVSGHHNSVGADMPEIFNETSIPQLMVLPVSADIVDGELLPYTSWEAAIRQQEVICVIPCACRVASEKMGTREPDCDANHGTETCIFMGDEGQYMIDRGAGRQLTQDECIELVKHNIDKGLVPEIVWTKTSNIMCQCCGDSCGVIGKSGGYLAYDCKGEIMKHCSCYTLSYDAETCIGCGACIDRCTMNAISIDESDAMVMDHHCIRCGQCAYICPVGARKLVPLPEDQIQAPDDDWLSKELRKARDRMARGFMYDFTGAEA